MTIRGSVGATPILSREQMSGHMNDDYSAPNNAPRYATPGPGRLRGVEPNTSRELKAKIMVGDITGVPHGTVPVSDNPGGFKFKVRES